MNETLQAILLNKYKILRTSMNESYNTSFSIFGIQCEDGWFSLLDKLCYDIELCLDDDEEFIVNQIKQKWGGLRFYYDTDSKSSDKIDSLVSLAEEQSFTICEICGKSGETVQTKGMWTLCPEHFEQQKKGTFNQ